MTDLEWAERFLGRFALPLVHGSAVQVGVPLARRGAERLLAAISGGLDGTATAEALAEARQRRLLELVPVISAPRLFEDRSAALLLVALHDLLFLHHPAASRLGERQAELLRGFTLQLIGRAAAQLPRVATRLPETGGEARLPTGAAEPRRLARRRPLDLALALRLVQPARRRRAPPATQAPILAAPPDPRIPQRQPPHARTAQTAPPSTPACAAMCRRPAPAQDAGGRRGSARRKRSASSSSENRCRDSPISRLMR